ncbi:MAG: hypothetical protein Q3986_08085 [Akkermansia sp.]|nr:hypothetical protein [Akkermansia sp.]
MSEENISTELVEAAAALVNSGDYSPIDLDLLCAEYGYTGDPSYLMEAVINL